jgi:hypothetical protein
MVTHNETASAVDHTTGPEENFWQLSERWEKCRLESNPDWIPPADSTFRMVTGTHTGSMNGEFHVYKPGLIFEQYPDGSSAYGPAVGPSPEYGLLVQGDWVGYYLDPSMTKKVMRNLMNFRQGITTAILERIGPLEAQSRVEGPEADDILESIQRERLDIVNQRLYGLSLEDEEPGNNPAQDYGGDLGSEDSASSSGIVPTPTTSVAPTSLGQPTPSTTTASRSGTTVMTPSTATDSTWRPSVVGENDSVSGGKSAKPAGPSQLWGGKKMNLAQFGPGASIHLGGGFSHARSTAGPLTEGGEAVDDTA